MSQISGEGKNRRSDVDWKMRTTAMLVIASQAVAVSAIASGSSHQTRPVYRTCHYIRNVTWSRRLKARFRQHPGAHCEARSDKRKKDEQTHPPAPTAIILITHINMVPTVGTRLYAIATM